MFILIPEAVQPGAHFIPRGLCAPFTLRSKIISMINREIRIAKTGKKAELFFKMNSLVDTVMIDKLYQASRAGVKVRLIVRGICSIIPGVRNLSENIKGISIIDKFLEHSRVFIFHNGGKPDIFIGSADLMARNLDFRVEVLTPILDKNARKQLIDVMEIQWSGNVKARVFDPEQSNKYKSGKGKRIRSQEAILDYYKSFYKSESKNKSKV